MGLALWLVPVLCFRGSGSRKLGKAAAGMGGSAPPRHGRIRIRIRACACLVPTVRARRDPGGVAALLLPVSDKTKNPYQLALDRLHPAPMHEHDTPLHDREREWSGGAKANGYRTRACLTQGGRTGHELHQTATSLRSRGVCWTPGQGR